MKSSGLILYWHICGPVTLFSLDTDAITSIDLRRLGRGGMGGHAKDSLDSCSTRKSTTSHLGTTSPTVTTPGVGRAPLGKGGSVVVAIT